MDVTICGLDELGLHRQAGVTHVLSILDPDWPEPGEVASTLWPRHDRLALRFPRRDRPVEWEMAPPGLDPRCAAIPEVWP